MTGTVKSGANSAQLGALMIRRLLCLLGILAAACSPTGTTTPRRTVPQRVVTLLPSLTEIAVALGGGGRIVGCTSYCPRAGLPAEVVDVGAPVSPSFERIAALRPDLVLLQTTQRNERDRLRAMGLRAEEISLIGFDEVLGAIGRIGQLLGLSDRATVLTGQIRADLAALAARVNSEPPVRTLLVVGHEPGALRQIVLAGPQTFLGRLLIAAGGNNVLTDTPVPYPTVGVEKILDLNPDAVLVLAPDEENTPAAQERERLVWSSVAYLAAVKNGRVYLLPDDDILNPGPGLADIARRLAMVLHPEAMR